MADNQRMSAAKTCHAKSRAKRFAFEMLCTVLSFLLVFNLSFSLQCAFADEGGNSGSETENPGGGETGGGESGGGGTEEPEPPAHYVDDLQVFLHKDESKVSLGFASTGASTSIVLDKKGQQVALIASVIWSDDSTQTNPTGVQFSSSDESVVTVDPSGYVVARGDGDATLTVSATRNTADGSPVSLRIPVQVSNQSGKSISKIEIYSKEYPDKQIITVRDKKKEDVYLTFYAKVTLDDGAVYDTRDGALSSQDPQLEDLRWFLSDAQMGAIEETTGTFRALAYGATSIFAMSPDYKTDSNRITLSVEDPDDRDGHPQSQLTVSISYEKPVEGAVTIEDQVFDVSDLMNKYDTFSQTYTLMNGSNGASQATGYGVSLRALLLDACKVAEEDGLDSILSVTFRSGEDGGNATLSIDSLFASRYTYDPYSYVSGVYSIIGTTEPMLAVESNWMSMYAIASGYEDGLSEKTRFRLLMGSQSENDSVASSSIKWINRIEVVMKGSPKVPDDDDDDDGGNNKSGGPGGTDEGGSGGSGTGTSIGLAGTGTGAGDGTGSGAQSNTAGSKSGAYSIYQMMSPYETDLDIQYAENPLKPFVLPLCLACIAAGLTQAGFWYRRQRQPLSVGGMTMAKGTA